MYKVKDISGCFFDLLKFEHQEWAQWWKEKGKTQHPTLYESYFRNLAISPCDEIQYIWRLCRKNLDTLYRFWMQRKTEIHQTLCECAGILYKSGNKDFGIFLFVGFDRKKIVVVPTKKGNAILCDIWFLRGNSFDAESRPFFTVAEFTSVLTGDDQRIPTRN